MLAEIFNSHLQLWKYHSTVKFVKSNATLCHRLVVGLPMATNFGECIAMAKQI